MGKLFEYSKHPVPTTGGFNFFCNNEGLLNKQIVFCSYNNAPHPTCLHSKWDNISAVHTVHNLFPWIPSLHHVCSHQDNHHKLGNLDLATIMNIKADKLATKALKDDSSQPIFPFDPACGAMLRIHGCAVTRNIKATVHRSQNLAPIKEYYCKCFGWCPKTLKRIDWDVFSMLFPKIPCTCMFFSKFGWKQLLIGNCLHKLSPSYDHCCPSCNQEYKTDDHIFQCKHILQPQWRTDLCQEMHDKFGSFIDPEL
jgi:hypothetical protein